METFLLFTHTHTLSLHDGNILDLTMLMCLADQCLMLVAIKVSISNTETQGLMATLAAVRCRDMNDFRNYTHNVINVSHLLFRWAETS